jgi:hypothetical protein
VSEPELIVKFWPPGVTAKGAMAIDAISRPGSNTGPRSVRRQSNYCCRRPSQSKGWLAIVGAILIVRLVLLVPKFLY